MRKILVKIGEAACVLLLAVFIVYVSTADRISTVPFGEIADTVVTVADVGKLKKRDALEFRDKFSFNAEDYIDFVCYSSETAMDVRELVIVFSDDKAALNKIKTNIEAYADEKQALFEDYAPEESKMISSHTLIQKKGYILFYIGQDEEKVASAFSEKL